MGINGDVTMTALQEATGISSNNLTSHHPSGVGNATRMSDFLIDAVGHREESFGPADYLRGIPVVGSPGKMFPGIANDRQSFVVYVSPAHLTNPGQQGGSGGQFFYEQIMKQKLEMTAGDFDGWDVIKNDPTTDDFLIFEIFAIARDTSGIAGSISFPSTLNSDATNADGAGINFSYTNVADTPQMARFTWSESDGTAQAVYYHPDNNVDLSYFSFRMSQSRTSPKGEVDVVTQGDGSTAVSFNWDPSTRNISGEGNADVRAYDSDGNLVGSLNAPSGSSGSVVAT